MILSHTYTSENAKGVKVARGMCGQVRVDRLFRECKVGLDLIIAIIGIGTRENYA